MNTTVPAPVDLGPGAAIAAIGALLATLMLAVAWWRGRSRYGHHDPVVARAQRVHGLLLLTLFLTFDLVVFGAYTRLSDSGLGCPDWPGCYASVSPVGAQAHIDQAQAALPTGPVTQHKAWVEMVHRYLATAVGALITLMTGLTWWQRHRPAPTSAGATATLGRGWATLCFVWVCLQGAFGAFTVTMKLYPAIVTLHLLGGVGLLALLAVAARRSSLALECHANAPADSWGPATLAAHRPLLITLLLLVIAQITLGGWVSTNYAVLACSDFPTCNGRWWPEADFSAGFTVLRDLGRQADGSLLPLPALTAIHLAHRIGAVVVLLAALLAAARLRHTAQFTNWPARALRLALVLLGVQILTGISNVVLGWPLLAALAHTGGAAALLAVLAAVLTSARARRPVFP
ncbi:MAG: hypothetical protein RIQ60_523 [Pseudomonadota bacterium]|jgi:cytochrome c oxidase assembly protein subunit 15